MSLTAVTDSAKQVELLFSGSTDHNHTCVTGDRCVTLVGGASVRLPSRLELREESLMSEATLAESESRSSYDSTLLEARDTGLRLQPPTG